MAIVATYTYKPGSESQRKAAIDDHLAFITGLGDKIGLLAVGLDGEYEGHIYRRHMSSTSTTAATEKMTSGACSIL